MRRISLIAFAAIALSLPARAQSFDCASHHKPDEVAICNDSTLSNLDSKMANLYYTAKHRAGASGEAALRLQQLEFLKKRRACKSSASCLREVLTARVGELTAFDGEAGKPRSNPAGETGVAAELSEADAHELLGLALKCPVPKYSEVGQYEDGVHTGWFLNEWFYSGSGRSFTIDAKRSQWVDLEHPDADSGVQDYRTKASGNFSDLGGVVIEDGHTIVFVCRPGRVACINYRYFDSDESPTFIRMRLCDSEMAHSAKVAVDRLMTLHGGGGADQDWLIKNKGEGERGYGAYIGKY